MPYGLNQGVPAPPPQPNDSGLDIGGLIRQLLGQTQQEQAGPMLPVPQDPTRSQRIGAIILGALRNPAGQQFFDQRHAEQLQAQQQNVMLQQRSAQAQGQQRNVLINALLDHVMAAQREQASQGRFEESQRGMNERFLAGQEAMNARFGAGLEQRKSEADTRETQTNQRLGLLEEQVNLAKERNKAMLDREAFNENFKAMMAGMGKAGRPLPAGEATKLSDKANSFNRAMAAKTMFIKLGKPGTTFGSGFLPQRLRSKALKDWAAYWESVQGPIRRQLLGQAQSAIEQENVKSLFAKIGTDAESTEASLNAIIGMSQGDLQQNVQGLESAGFNMERFKSMFEQPATGQ